MPGDAAPDRPDAGEPGRPFAGLGERAAEFVENRISTEFVCAIFVAAAVVVVQGLLADLRLAEPLGAWVMVYVAPAIAACAVALAKRRRGKAKMLAIAGMLPLTEAVKAQASSWTSTLASAAVASTVTVAGATAAEAALGLDSTFFSRGVPAGERFLLTSSGGPADVAVDASGTGHFVWVDEDGVAHYCQVPQGGRSCAVEHEFGSGQRRGAGEIRVLLAGPERVIVLHDRCCTVVSAYVSADGGSAFSARRDVSELSNPSTIGQPAVGPGEGIVSLVGGPRSGVYHAVSLDGPPVDETRQAELGLGWWSSVVLIEGEIPIVAYDDLGTIFFRRWTGQGDVNDAANWDDPVRIGPGKEGTLAGGPAGIYLLYTTWNDDGTKVLVVRRFEGARFGPETVVSDVDRSTNDVNAVLSQDAGGRLYAAWSTSVFLDEGDRVTRVALRSTSGGSWGPIRIVARSPDIASPNVAAGPDGRGFLTWSEDWHRNDAAAFAQPFGMSP